MYSYVLGADGKTFLLLGEKKKLYILERYYEKLGNESKASRICNFFFHISVYSLPIVISQGTIVLIFQEER